jgi:hypothetical protein
MTSVASNLVDTPPPAQELVTWAAATAERWLGADAKRWTHVREVARRAQEVAPALPAAQRPLLVAAAYLHDIGWAPGLRDSGFHPLDGARWLRAQGREDLAGLVAHHSAADVEAELRGLDDQLGQFPDGPPAVSDALAYCDVTSGSGGGTVTLDERMADVQRRYGEDHIVTVAMRRALPLLAAMVERTTTRLGSRAFT